MDVVNRLWAMLPSQHDLKQKKPTRRLSDYMFQPIKEDQDASPVDTESAERSDDISDSSATSHVSPSPTEWVSSSFSQLDEVSRGSDDASRYLALGQMTVTMSQSFTDDCSSELERIWEQSAQSKTSFRDQKYSATPRSNITMVESESLEDVAHGEIKSKVKSSLYMYDIANDSASAEKGAKIDHYWELCQDDAEHLTSMGTASANFVSTHHHSASTDLSASSEVFDDDDRLGDKRQTRKRKSVTFLENKDVHVLETDPHGLHWESYTPDAKKSKLYSKRKKKIVGKISKHGDNEENLLEKNLPNNSHRRRNGDQASRNTLRMKHKDEFNKHLLEKRKTTKTAHEIGKSYRSVSLESLQGFASCRSNKGITKTKRTKAKTRKTLADIGGSSIQHKLSNPELTRRDKSNPKQLKETYTYCEVGRRLSGEAYNSPSKSNIERALTPSENRSLDERLLEALICQKEDRLIRKRSAELAALGCLPSSVKKGKNNCRAASISWMYKSRQLNTSVKERSLRHPSQSSSTDHHHLAPPMSTKSSKLKPRNAPFYYNLKRKRHKENKPVRSNEKQSKSELSLRRIKPKRSNSTPRNKQRNTPKQTLTYRSDSSSPLKKKISKREHLDMSTKTIKRTKSEPSFHQEMNQSLAKKRKYTRSNSLTTDNRKRPVERTYLSSQTKPHDGFKSKVLASERKKSIKPTATPKAPNDKLSNRFVNGASFSKSSANSKTNSGVKFKTKKSKPISKSTDMTNFARSRLQSPKQRKYNSTPSPSKKRNKGSRSTSLSKFADTQTHSKTMKSSHSDDKNTREDTSSKSSFEVKQNNSRPSSAASSNHSREHQNIPNTSHVKGILKNRLVQSSEPSADTIDNDVAMVEQLPPPLSINDRSVTDFEVSQTKMVTASTATYPRYSLPSPPMAKTELKHCTYSASPVKKTKDCTFFWYLQDSAARLVQEVKETFRLIDMVEGLAVEELVESKRDLDSVYGLNNKTFNPNKPGSGKK